jgi:hypothetical protein
MKSDGNGRILTATVALMMTGGLVQAQSFLAPSKVTSQSSPYQETSAGRALQRIMFGSIDCDRTKKNAFGGYDCSNDGFATSGIFNNGTYADLRAQFSGDPSVNGVPEFLLNRFVTQSQTFPTAASASGFTFSWRGGATPSRNSELFGSLFGDRALTNGRGQFSATLSFERLSWESLDGSKIRENGSDPGLLWGDFDYAGPDSGFPAGSSYVGKCRMNITSESAMVALNYGISERLDVSVGVPIVHTTVDGSNEFVDFVGQNGVVTALGAATGFIPQGRFYVKGSSTGIGDLDVSAKASLHRGSHSALALTAGARIGTGSFEKMTGTGESQGRAGLIWSYERNGLSPHASVAYVLGGDTLYDEVNYTAGLDVKAVADRLTVGAEFVGRRLFNVEGFAAGSTFDPGVVASPAGTGETFALQKFTATRDDFNLFFVALGGKYRLVGQLLGTAYVLIPAGGSGLQAQKPTFNFGFNYAL